MLLARRHLTVLLNALHETGKRRVTVRHPCEDVGELLCFDLEGAFDSPVRFTQSLSGYDGTREAIRQQYGENAYEDLPDENTYVRCLVASGALDVENREDVDRFLDRHGYRDLEAGHDPLVAGIDANVMPWRVGDVLGIDHREDRRDDGRAPTNGYALATGVKEELDWHYKQHRTRSLVEAFGEAFERVDNQPAGGNREGFLGLYEYRRLMADRNVDRVECGTGDEEIVDGYRRFDDESRKEVVLFSNDFGFVERAEDAGLLAQHVDFPRSLPGETTASWDDLGRLLYYLAVRFGVLELPGVTLYGVWNGKDGRHWQDEELAVEFRSPKLEPPVERDRAIVDAYEG